MNRFLTLFVLLGGFIGMAVGLIDNGPLRQPLRFIGAAIIGAVIGYSTGLLFSVSRTLIAPYARPRHCNRNSAKKEEKLDKEALKLRKSRPNQ